MEKTRIGINGVGRIGRMVLRLAQDHPEVEIAAINATNPTDYLAYLVQYDTTHGFYRGEVSYDENHLILNGKKIPVMSDRDPANLHWGEYGADYVLECTGKFLTKEKSQPHLDVGAKKVIMSAPPKDDTPLFVCGVNLDMYTPDINIVSNASCTTNCIAPLARVLNDAFGIRRGVMTTVHSTTATQLTVDGTSKKDWRGGRAASANIIPTATGAAQSVGKVIPELQGRLTGMSLRVPTLDVSVVDLTANLELAATGEDICAVMKQASQGRMKGILGYTDVPMVSSDFIGNTCTCVFDALSGIFLTEHFIKVLAWYDNETAYADKLICLAEHMHSVDCAK